MNLEKFVDALPILSVLKPEGFLEGHPYYEVTMKQVKQKLHRDLPATTVWGYNGLYPGPTFEVRKDEPVFVKWKNKLPYKHLLPIDRTLHGAEPDKPSVRTVVHLHQGLARPEDDGYPESWFTRNFTNVGPTFEKKIYHYPNTQRPATLWYHDHTLGITRLNVYAGLAGFYLIRDEHEEKLNLPHGKYEIPLLLQDRSFYPNGELFYPTQPGHEVPPAEQPPPPIDPNLPNPSVVPEFFGDTNLVNGKVWPFLKVEPRKYRFRILNGSNSRFYRISLGVDGLDFTLIGTDGGLLEKPITVSEITLAPAERADVIVDFSAHKGERIILKNNAPTPFPDGESPSEDLQQIMKFVVKKRLKSPDDSCIPKKLSSLTCPDPRDAVAIRKNILVETTDEFGRLMLLLNNMEWSEKPITETPYNGTVEIWELYNQTPDTHPIHLHLVTFMILNRAKFSGDPFGPDLKVDQPFAPEPIEQGWKDTVRVNPGEVTRIIIPFRPFTGVYPWHCHILEHEDHQMMRPYEILDNPSDENKK